MNDRSDRTGDRQRSALGRRRAARPAWVITAEAEIVGGAGFGSGGRLPPRSSEDSEAGYPESGCGDDGENDGCGGRLTGGKAMAAKPSSSCNSPSKQPAPATDWPGTASSWSAPDQWPCHAVPSAFHHEQVSERKTRTGRNPGSIQRIISKSCCTRPQPP